MANSPNDLRWRVLAAALLGCGCGQETTRGAEAAMGGNGSPAGGYPVVVAAGQSVGATGASGGPVFAGGGGAGDGGVGGTPPSPTGGSDTSGSAGTPGVTDCSASFCEDFESGQVDAARWDLQTLGGATVEVQSERAAHGKYALRAHALGTATGSQTAYAYLLTKQAPLALATHNFGRAFLLTSPAPHSNNIGLIYGGTIGFPKPTYLSIAAHGGGWQFGFIELSGSPTGERQAHIAEPMAVLKWICLEWELNDQPDQINVWVDGASIGSFDADHIDYPPGHVPGAPIFDNRSAGLVGAFEQFGFGVYDWHPGGFDYDFYYDDIVLDAKRVGCET